MRDIIQRVLATEAEARQIVEVARAEADLILSDAQKSGQEFVARARREARAEAERIVEAVTHTAEREKQESLALAAAEIEREVRLAPADREHAVQAVVRCVCRQR